MIRLMILTSMILLSGSLSSQTANRIIPFELGFPGALELKGEDGSYILPILYGNNNKSAIITVAESDVTVAPFLNFSFSLQGMNTIHDNKYVYGKDRSKSKNLLVYVLDKDFLEIDRYEYDTPGDSNFPTRSFVINDEIYLTYIMDFNEDDHREFGITKVDTSGHVIWSENYSQDNKLNYVYDLDVSLDSQLLVSSRVVYNDILGGFPEFRKVDSEGETTMYYVSDEAAEGGNAVYLVPLSSGLIVQTYIKELIGQEWIQYSLDGFSKWPARFNWIDEEGTIVQTRLDKFDRDVDMRYAGLKAGKGDYFWGYGRHDDKEYYSGFVTKFDNNGDTIWTHLYKHPDYLEDRTPYFLRDIVEEEDGSISGVGVISPQGEIGKLWFFKTDAEGCILNDCNQIVLDDEEIQTEQQPSLYPNPTGGAITITDLDSYQNYCFTLIDALGQKVLQDCSQPSGLDLSTLATGVYMLQITDDRGHQHVEKVVKR